MNHKRSARLQQLRALTARDGAMRLADAAASLGVSGMTLRRDLTDAEAGLDLLGGYVIPRNGGTLPYRLDVEQDTHLGAKMEAGRCAAGMVSPGDTIFVDCGTTMPHLMTALPRDIRLTIVCFSLNIANVASRMPGVQLYLLGGLYHASAATFLSEDALEGLARLGIGKAFFSAGGLHETHGATCANFEEVPVKRAVLARAANPILVIDSSKVGRIGPAHFAPPEIFGQVITEHGVQQRNLLQRSKRSRR